LLGWNVRLLTGKLPQLARSGLGRRLQESALDAGVSDLLTVRGAAKPVKPDRLPHQSGLSVLCPADTLKINEETMASLALPQRHC
jgi:hypothetical protein